MIAQAELKQAEIGEEPMRSERDGINPAVEPSGTGCVECLALGGWWFHSTIGSQPVIESADLSVRMFGSSGKKRANASSNCAAL